VKVKGFNNSKPMIGVIYLPPSLGYPNHPGMNQLVEHALEDLEVLKKCGVDGALLENENDRPYTVLAGPATIASMSVAASKIIDHCDDIVLGAEFLINDPEASLAVAKASGCSFIRTDYFVDRMSREEYGGEMRIDPDAVMKFKKDIQGDEIAFFSDIQVKYATMLEEKTLGQSAREAYNKGSDGAVVSGKITGIPPQVADLLEAKESGCDIPLLIGSGLALDNLEELLPVCDGAIVGTAFFKEGNRMDYEKIAPFMDMVRKFRG
jgi:membrane complex biogenesis BtpA family protein